MRLVFRGLSTHQWVGSALVATSRNVDTGRFWFGRMRQDSHRIYANRSLRRFEARMSISFVLPFCATSNDCRVFMFIKNASSSLAASSLIETAHIAVDLHPAPIEPSWVIDGDPQARARQLYKSLDRQLWTVVWECTEGRFNWHYSVDETILILEGSIVLESDVLPPTRYSAGDTILFRKGAHARWHVEGYVKKLAVFHRVLPTPIALIVRSLGVLMRAFTSGNRASLSGQLQ
jgi:uncharacterized protein